MQAETNLGYLLHHLASTLDRRSELILQRQVGIGFSQFKVLMALKVRDGVQQRQIAESLGQTEASVSRQIKLLQDLGLLQHKISPHNRRQHITKLTAKGNRLTETAMATLNAYHAPLFASLLPEQQHALIDSLQIMHRQTCPSGSQCASELY